MKRAIILIFFTLGITFAPKTFAYVLLTFQTENYSPSFYIGKNLPITGSKINLGAELVLNDRIQDLKNYKIYWYLDGKLFARGYGLKQTSFVVGNTSGYNNLINIEIKKGSKSYESSLVIPIKSPSVIMKHPDFLMEKNNIFQAFPYFFNVDNLNELNFNWIINEKEKEGDNILNLNFSNYPMKSQKIDVSVKVSNKNNYLEIGKSKMVSLSTL